MTVDVRDWAKLKLGLIKCQRKGSIHVIIRVYIMSLKEYRPYWQAVVILAERVCFVPAVLCC
jgi:hypothetical protein